MIALIPLGVRFDVLRVPQPLGLTLLWELGDEADKTAVLEEHTLPRPCLHLPVKPGRMDDHWGDSPEQTMLSRGVDWPAPSPAANAITGVQQHGLLWRIPPDGSGRFADPDTLHHALTRARGPARQAARIRAAHSVFWTTRRNRHT
ncbi:hypothetical protein [Streptomyces sp. NPDC057694]|uniref:hypothetical protein n=1 Tax=Streptomyces sp. NPDC057694 TaxID=3346216 RepID=UPI003686283D